MPVQPTVQFLNVDLVLVGSFDRAPLVAAAGKRVFVLQEDVPFDGRRRAMVLESSTTARSLSGTLSALLRWVDELPPSARRSWKAASRRIFDIGVQSGLQPHETSWTLRNRELAALERAGAEVMVTLYGAKWRDVRSTNRRRSSRGPSDGTPMKAAKSRP